MRRVCNAFLQGRKIQYKHIVLIFLLSVLVTLTLYASVAREWQLFPTYDFRTYHEHPILEHEAIKRECNARREWRDHFFLHCEFRMGAFNAINRLQVCIRLAMSAGIGLMMPEFITRGNTLWVQGDFPSVSLNYLLDQEFLLESLKLNCPRLVIANKSSVGPFNTLHGDFTPMRMNHTGPGHYTQYIDELIACHPPLDPLLPTILFEGDTLGNWRRDADPLDFQFAFHNIFPFSPVLMEISDHILNRLPHLFIGVHLRLEDDWVGARKEVDLYDFVDAVVERTRAAQSETAYVACGDVKVLKEFKSVAAQRGVTVVTKWDLTNSAYREKMEKQLEFDQLGIVDFEVLFHSAYFLGYCGSSFSVSMGQRRHMAQYGNLNFLDHDTQQYLLGPEALRMFTNKLWA